MGFKSDIEIAQETEMKVINEIADKIGIPDRYVENYGKYKAKIDYRYYSEELESGKDAKVVLVRSKGRSGRRRLCSGCAYGGHQPSFYRGSSCDWRCKQSDRGNA